MSWMDYTDKLFTEWGFLTFPFVGGSIGLAIMHIVRIRCWVKLHHRVMLEREGWTWKHTVGIVLLDEAIWLIAFAAIFTLLLILVSV